MHSDKKVRERGEPSQATNGGSRHRSRIWRKDLYFPAVPPLKAILFDLDDTLLDEASAVAESYRATAALAAGRGDLPVEQLQQVARETARRIWLAHPDHPYAKRIGVSSWEALWARFLGDRPEVKRWRSWAPTYRHSVWSDALEQLGVRDEELAGRMADGFVTNRRRLHPLFPQTRSTLGLLRERGAYRLGLLTNGLSCLQREKIHGAGLEAYFDAICVSGDLGIGKPEALPFRTVLGAMGVDPADAVMVGDNPERDIGGAHRLGIRTVFVEQGTHGDKPGPEPDARIPNLGPLPDLVDRWSAE